MQCISIFIGAFSIILVLCIAFLIYKFVFYEFYGNSITNSDLKIMLSNSDINVSDEEADFILKKMKSGTANFDITLRGKTNDRALKVTFMKESEDI